MSILYKQLVNATMFVLPCLIARKEKADKSSYP